MDPETEIGKLLEEENFIEGILKELKVLKKRKGYADLLEDTTTLIDKLKDRKKQIKRTIDSLTNEVITIAEACAMDT